MIAVHRAAALDDPQAMRHAGRDLLSLALIDARNHLLSLLAQDASAAAVQRCVSAAWYADYWICRHVQRQRGEACDAAAPRLAGIEPRADGWAAGALDPPTPEVLRSYLAETLEITQDLLAAAADDDAALYFYRQCLLHEDRVCEALMERQLYGAPPTRAERPPLWLPARRWMLGSRPGGQVPHNERWAHEVAVPEFEIDAQPVNWARYVEFSEDGGYDRADLWSDRGWAWVQRQGRRVPAHVEQMQGAVLARRRHGAAIAMTRLPLAQPVMHVSHHEAEAWCRWAGRRLPTEPEWEMAASIGERRGFVWGDVFEWVAGSARAWPGADHALPGSLDLLPEPGTQSVLRGGSCATRRRRVYPQARRFARREHDTMFCGFRSCEI